MRLERTPDKREVTGSTPVGPTEIGKEEAVGLGDMLFWLFKISMGN